MCQWMLGGKAFGWLEGGCVSKCAWVTKRDKASESDEIIMCMSAIHRVCFAFVGGLCLHVCVFVCV